MNPYLSICIPAYKRTDFLKRLLDSIVIQDFREFEVIVTDDSPDNSVRELCEDYASRLPLKYFRNEVVLGTPENWNEAIRNAGGEWIKLMHDDDWFSRPDSLTRFVKAAKDITGSDFIFSAYTNHYSESGKTSKVTLNGFRFRALLKNPVTLFSKNVIGPPSVTMHRNTGEFFYDRTVKWVVDIDFYIRYFKSTTPFYIDRPLINVGLGAHQVTMDCVRQRTVEIPENFYLLNKAGTSELRNILVFDAWWRLMRNLEIRSPKDINDAGYKGPISPIILSIIGFQNKFPVKVLKQGVYSKILMLLCYLKTRNL